MRLAALALAAALLAAPAAAQQQSSQQRQLDAAVMAAIARGDLRHAREIAVTADHWQWIAEAQGGTRKSGAELQRDAANSQACADARRSYEVEATRIKENWAAQEQKRQAVRIACGSTRY